MLAVAAKRACLAAALAAGLGAAGCGGGSSSSSLPAGCQEVGRPPAKSVHLKAPRKRVSPKAKLLAVVKTSCGGFRILLDPRTSPKTVSSFVYLARKGVYDDTEFLRIVPHFIIQGGSPQGTRTGGPGYSVDEPPPPNTRYTAGTVAMSRAAIEPPGRSGSQFFVVLAADAGLPPSYAILGRVASADKGIIGRIASLGDPATGDEGTPEAPVVIRTIQVKSR